MFGAIRELAEANQALRRELAGIGDRVEAWLARPVEPVVFDQSDLLERLDKLERSRALWEATMEAELLKAESKYKSARNAESRARTMAANDEPEEGDIAGPEEIAEAYREAGFLPSGDAGGGNGEQMQLLREGVESVSPKARALAHKYGG